MRTREGNCIKEVGKLFIVHQCYGKCTKDADHENYTYYMCTTLGHCVFGIARNERTVFAHQCFGNCRLEEKKAQKEKLPIIEMSIGGNHCKLAPARYHLCFGECSTHPLVKYQHVLFIRSNHCENAVDYLNDLKKNYPPAPYYKPKVMTLSEYIELIKNRRRKAVERGYFITEKEYI